MILAAFLAFLAPAPAPPPQGAAHAARSAPPISNPTDRTADDAAKGLALGVLGSPPPHVVDPFGQGFDAYGVVAALPGGDRVTFDGQHVRRCTAGGFEVALLATLPAPAFAAFARVFPGGDAVLVGESTNGRIWRVELDGSGKTLIADLVFPFDATFLDADSIVVSTASCVACANELLQIDWPAGTQTPLVELSGPSGPVVADNAGGLFVGDFSSPLGGAARVLHLPAGLLQGPLPVLESDLTLVSDGYVGASSLAYDAELDRLYIAANDAGSGASAVKLVGGDAATDEALVQGVPFRWLADLQLVPGSVGAFHPYQPASGGRLEISSTDFVNGDIKRLALKGARPSAKIDVVGGSQVRLNLTGAPPRGAALLFVASASAVVDNYALQLGEELPLVLGLALGSFELASEVLAIDADGQAELTFPLSGTPGSLAVQLVCMSASGDVVGTSTTALL